MATAASDDGRHSPAWLRPDFSDQRVVLIGNNWSQRSFVGNLLLGKPVFDTETEPQQPELRKEELHNKLITVINTPDLLQPDLAADRLTELVTEIVSASAPGPHVFLLVLQPEDFTEQQKTCLLSILERFSERASYHSLLLISTPRAEMTEWMQRKHPQLQDMIQFCEYRYLCCEYNLDQEELMTRLEQLMKKNNGEHVFLKSCYQTQHIEELPNKQGQAQHFRIVLFGKTEDTRQAIITRITGRESKGRVLAGINKQTNKNKAEECEGKWKGNKIKVVKSQSNLFKLPVAAVKKEVKSCVSQCSPGPNVLLLLVKPSDFTEDDMETLRFILSLFGPDVFKHSMVVLTNKGKTGRKNLPKHVDDLILDCESRCYSKDELNRDDFLEEIENIVKKNKGSCVSLSVDNKSGQKQKKMSLNLVLCGSREAKKSSVVKSILGRAELPAASSPGQCVNHQGEVRGRWVSLVELPALSGKPLETVMQQCFHCISLCAPEGVHAFILVLPLGQLTDEDKTELKIIQDTLGSRVCLFTMIMVPVDSTAAAARVDRDIQELSQSCGGGYLTFNISDQQDVSVLLKSVEQLRTKHESHSFTTEMFFQGQLENYVELHKELKSMKTGQGITCDEKPSTDSLRIVLIGKTGSGKSSSGNTILGREEYKSETSQISVTRVCEKAVTEVDGRHVAVVDTPGLFDTKMSNEYIMDEMLRCVSLLAPGPHVFLLTLGIGRFTDEEKETLKHIKSGFGKDAQMFTIILLTHGDNLEADDISIEDFIRDKCDDSFKKLISDCGNRYHVFNNRKSDRTQVKELLQKIDSMVKQNGGGCYTNKMLQEAEVAIKKEMERIMKEKEEEMARERERLESKHKQELEEMKQKLEEEKNKIEKERMQRTQELKEKEEKIKEEQEQRKREKEQRDADDRKRKAEEEQERREWEQKHTALEEKIKSEEESKETIDRKLQEMSKQMEQERKQRENERHDWWEKRNQDEERRRKEEEQKIKKLQDEYKVQQEKDKNKREEEDRIRQEQEEKERLNLEEKHQRQVEELRRAFEEEARKKAEEFNDFKDHKEAEIEALLDQHIKEIRNLQQGYEDEKNDMQKKFDSTLNEKEMSLKDDITKLQCTHKQELGDVVILLLTLKKTNKEKMSSLKKSHQKQLKEKEEYIKSKFKTKEKDEIKQLKKEQKHELNQLALDIKIKEELKEKKRELCLKHEIDVNTLKNRLLEKQMKELKTETTKLKTKQEEELAERTQELLEENEKVEEEQLAKLQNKHDKEMKELMKKAEAQSGDREELQELQKKHVKEIKELKEKLLTPEDKLCNVS